MNKIFLYGYLLYSEFYQYLITHLIVVSPIGYLLLSIDNYSVSVIAFVLTTVNSTYAMQEAVDQGFQINFYFKNTRVFERGLHQTY